MILLTEFQASPWHNTLWAVLPSISYFAVRSRVVLSRWPWMPLEFRLPVSTQAEAEETGMNISIWSMLKINPQDVTVAPEKFSSRGIFPGLNWDWEWGVDSSRVAQRRFEWCHHLVAPPLCQRALRLHCAARSGSCNLQGPPGKFTRWTVGNISTFKRASGLWRCCVSEALLC